MGRTKAIPQTPVLVPEAILGPPEQVRDDDARTVAHTPLYKGTVGKSETEILMKLALLPGPGTRHPRSRSEYPTRRPF